MLPALLFSARSHLRLLRTPPSYPMKSFLILFALTIAFSSAFAGDLPRKMQTPRETYPNVDVIHDSVTTPRGERLRTIITKPRSVKGKLPVIFVAGWLSCDSVEAPENTKDETSMLFRQLAPVSYTHLTLPTICSV